MDRKMETFWDDQASPAHVHGQPNGHAGSYERNLNFSTVAVEDGEYGFPKKKTVRDPLSHRIIEKRRRDRMNNCLADLARLLPPSSLRKGRGRIEKTEIVELAIKHLKHLQCHPCPNSDNCEYNQIPLPRATHTKSSSPTSSSSSGTTGTGVTNDLRMSEEQFRLGFQESTSETMHFLVETEGMYPGDELCVRLVQHLNSHLDGLLRDDNGNNRRLTLGIGAGRGTGNGKKSAASGSISSGYQPNGSSGSGSDGNGAGPVKSTILPSATPTESGNLFDLEGDGNSCSSAPLSLDITDSYSTEGKMTGRSQSKPPIPTIICSHSSSNNSCTCKVANSSGSPPALTASSSNSDEGHSATGSAAHRYKFKNNIKQRFTADLHLSEVIEDESPSDMDKGSDLSASKSSRKSKFGGKSQTEAGSPIPFPYAEEAELSIDADSEEPTGTRKRLSSITSVDGEVSQSSEKPQGAKSATKDDLEQGLVKIATVVSTPTVSPGVTLRKVTALDGSSERSLKMVPVLGTAGSPEPLDQKPLTLPIVATVSDGKIAALCGTAKGVPAFALHEKGLFYIPLTIDPAIIAPFIAAMDPASQPPLHPVTISVCFLLNTDAKKPFDLPPSPPMPFPAIPTSIRTRVSDIVSIDLSGARQSPSLQHLGSKRESREFILNRYAQSQVPMVFTSSATGQDYQGPQHFDSLHPPTSMPNRSSNSIQGRGSISSSSNSSQSSYYTVHKQHSPGHRPLNADPSIVYQHSSLNPTPISTTYYPNARSAVAEAINPSPLSASSNRSRAPSGTAGSDSHSHSGSSSSHGSHRKRSVSISPSVSSGYVSWEGKPSRMADPVYDRDPVYVSGTLGDDHGHTSSRPTSRSYAVGGGYQQMNAHNRAEHYSDQRHESHHRPPYSLQYYNESDFGDRDHGTPAKRTKKSRDSVGEAMPPSTYAITVSRHSTP